ncbi:RelE family toxin-antitoxin system [Klebsiella pneumoniae]|nr:hypothetical protein LT23_03007 [Klebsiella pneumoniae]SBG49912.1 RelE family toxin-antitoxin system [Klebsiella pneumoniae]SBJ71623.1 RelE family toxin-antitoxin system [Klebsiella pneumoniae]HBT4766935.1 hypothetical protein [Klebsiella pneumoniae]HBY1078701.1 hypothetical protein [Klebsiella pneumoniae]
MTTDITELAQREKFEAWFKSSFHPDKTGPYIKDQLYFAWKAAGAELVEALEKAQQQMTESENRVRKQNRHICELFDDNTALRQRIAELEREQEQLRPVGVMSEKAFHRLENSECRFIALWPRPGIFLQRKRPEDGVIVYARTAASAGIKMEAE